MNTPATSVSQDIFIGRQPILDKHQELYAYELLFRSSSHNAAVVTDNMVATASVISHAFSELGIENALGPYKGFVNCDAALLMSDLPELMPPEKIVLEILETVEVDAALVERCKQLKAEGFTLAIDDFIDDVQKWLPLLGIVDIIKVDIAAVPPGGMAPITTALRKFPGKLLAEKVDTREQVLMCQQLGYDYFQGYYFARPTIIAGRKLGQSQAALLKLMSLILSDAETTDLETAFKQQPGLAVNLLRLTNSVATGVRMKVTSLRHAIAVLGRRQLQRWLQLVLYTNPESRNFPGPLMHLAATRGRMLELLAGRFKSGNRDFEDHAFLVGIMSLMPALMSASMEDVLAGLPLDTEITGALTGYAGPLGQMLLLAEALEASDVEKCRQLTAALGTDAETVNVCLTQALTWAGNIGKEAF